MMNFDCVERKMKLFGKVISGKVARDLITRLVLIVVSGTVLVISAVTTAAWFSSNTKVNTTGMQVVVKTDNYELIVRRTTEFDTVDNGDPVYPGVAEFKTELGNEGYDYDTETSTMDYSMLAFELENEYTFEGKHFLRPGAYGTLTFYLKPAVDGDLSVSFDLSIGGYANVLVWECSQHHIDRSTEEPASCAVCGESGHFTSKTIIEEVTNAAVLNYLKGHLLFFTGRTGADYALYQYSGLISDGTFTYNTSEHSAIVGGTFDGCYEVTLYWEWPLTYSEISTNISTIDSPQNKKYPSNVGGYFTSNKNYFLAKNLNSEDETELDDGYNDADQIIGESVNYIVAYISNG